jgi:hypothetical protein
MEWTKSLTTEYQTGERHKETLEEIEERLADDINCYIE